MIAGLLIDGGEVRRVPKLGLTLPEVEFAFGGQSLVKELRGIGALVPCGQARQAMVFDAGDVSRVWAEFRAGNYNAQLARWKGGLGELRGG